MLSALDVGAPRRSLPLRRARAARRGAMTVRGPERSRLDLENPHALREPGRVSGSGAGVVTDARVAAGERNVGRRASLRGSRPSPTTSSRRSPRTRAREGARSRLDRASRSRSSSPSPRSCRRCSRSTTSSSGATTSSRWSPRASARSPPRARIGARTCSPSTSARAPRSARAPALRAACARGACVEISYNPALSLDPARRRNFFANAAQLARLVGPGAGGAPAPARTPPRAAASCHRRRVTRRRRAPRPVRRRQPRDALRHERRTGQGRDVHPRGRAVDQGRGEAKDRARREVGSLLSSREGGREPSASVVRRCIDRFVSRFIHLRLARVSLTSPPEAPRPRPSSAPRVRPRPPPRGRGS